ncbi:unnamed protein product [Ectocarpus sp. 8 AP-2014]
MVQTALACPLRWWCATRLCSFWNPGRSAEHSGKSGTVPSSNSMAANRGVSSSAFFLVTRQRKAAPRPGIAFSFKNILHQNPYHAT